MNSDIEDCDDNEDQDVDVHHRGVTFAEFAFRVDELNAVLHAEPAQIITGTTYIYVHTKKRETHSIIPYISYYCIKLRMHIIEGPNKRTARLAHASDRLDNIKIGFYRNG